MKYAMLIHYRPGHTDALSEDEFEAIELAARIPAARLGGSIEVRTLVEH